MSSLFVILATFLAADEPAAIEVRLPLNEALEVDVGELVTKLAGATGVDEPRRGGMLLLRVSGVGGSLSRSTLSELLGAEARLAVEDGALVVFVDPKVRDPATSAEWKAGLARLGRHVEAEARRRASYGMRALKSYRPNDPTRPTVCLVHGLNSSSGGFVHMIKPLEEAGFGLVVYDYPYNRDLAESSMRFAADWRAFRARHGETRAWAIVAHSMGALVARWYVEASPDYAGDVSTLALVAPVNQGSSLAKAQTFLQLLKGVQAVQKKKTADALAHLGDGLGEAARDLTPGSAYLTDLNRHARRPGVSYHILAGDVGVLSPSGRAQVEARIGAMRNERGLLGGLTRIATADLASRLDELSDGHGDGCVSVEHTRLAGVADHVVVHANHAELIRAPLLFSDPGPVVCMPYLIRWLGGTTPPPEQPARGR